MEVSTCCGSSYEIDDARKVMLKLILYMNTADKGISAEKDEAVLGALRWLKNNVS